MLLTITCETENAPDFGYLLHKNPASLFEDERWFGKIRVFYPEVTPDRCTVALMLDVDPVGLVRGGGRASTLAQYVNDRPYVASSLLSVAISEAFGSALNGKSRERPERVGEKMQVTARMPALDCNGGAELIERLFVPLGYAVTTERLPLDARFPMWGDSSLYSVTLSGKQTVQALLTHLYVLIPVLDNEKHYFIASDEVDKLLKKGEGWLATHPEKDLITRRYLFYRQAMVREALNALAVPKEDSPESQSETDTRQEAQEESAEKPMHLNEARMEAAVRACQTLEPPAHCALDLGCGEGRLLGLLRQERTLTEIVGVDVSSHVLEGAARRLKLDNLPQRERARFQLYQGSLVYRDERFSGFDVAFLMEVIEHLDPPRLTALEGVVFRHARPRRVVLSTPNREYNVRWPSLPAGKFRHRDHRFEWSRAEFQSWAEQIAEKHRYTVTFQGIGPEDVEVGSPTQMAIFDRGE